MNGFIIISRLGSSRLKKKHLLKINKKPIVEHFIERIVNNFPTENYKIVLATTDQIIDQKFDYLEKKYSISVYHGNESNIPLRIYNSIKHFKIKKAVILEGDDLLFSLSAVKKIILKLNEGYDFVKTIGLPIGMNSYGMTQKLFSENIKSFYKERKIETGWLRFIDSMPKKIIFRINESHKYRFTLDYREDLFFFKSIFEYFKERIHLVDHLEIIHFVNSNKVFIKNNFLEKKYNENFNTKLTNEK